MHPWRPLLLLLPLVLTAGLLSAAEPVPERFARLADTNRARIVDLGARLDAESKQLPTLPQDHPFIDVAAELTAFATNDDLLVLLTDDHGRLRDGAHDVLEKKDRLATLTTAEVERVLPILAIEDSSANWRGGWLTNILYRDDRIGIPVITTVFETSDSRYAKVHAAAALRQTTCDIDDDLRQRAKTALVAMLCDTDDVSRLAHNGIQPLEPWMSTILIDRLLSERFDQDAWASGHPLSLLASVRTEALQARLRAVFLRALEAGTTRQTCDGLRGLSYQGFLVEDHDLLAGLLKHEHETARNIILSGLGRVEDTWPTALLLQGCDDPVQRNADASFEGLAAIKARSVVPALMKRLRTQLAATPQDMETVARLRVIGAALTELTGREHDFHQRFHCSGGAMRVYTISDRPEVYRKEATALLAWWDAEGHQQDWQDDVEQESSTP